MFRKHVVSAVSASRIWLGFFGALMAPDHPVVSFWCFVTALITDLIDGPLARKLGTAGLAGAMLDSVADWFLGASSFVTLLVVGWLPWWSLLVVGVPTAVFTTARLHRELRKSCTLRFAGVIFFTAVYAWLGLGYLDRAYGWHDYYWLVLAGGLLLVAVSQLPKVATAVTPKSLSERLP